MKRLIVAALLGVVSACSLISHGGGGVPEPMRQFEIHFENRSDALFEMRVAERQRPPTMAVRVDPCSAGSLRSAFLEPLSVGLADVDAPMEQRGMQVADSTAWQAAGDDAVVIVIHPDGDATVETRADPPAASDDACP